MSLLLLQGAGIALAHFDSYWLCALYDATPSYRHYHGELWPQQCYKGTMAPPVLQGVLTSPVLQLALASPVPMSALVSAVPHGRISAYMCTDTHAHCTSDLLTSFYCGRSSFFSLLTMIDKQFPCVAGKRHV